ncbi:MAG: hypothetical protein ABIV48_06845 [Pyrinomonadaceae bacterium]
MPHEAVQMAYEAGKIANEARKFTFEGRLAADEAVKVAFYSQNLTVY